MDEADNIRMKVVILYMLFFVLAGILLLVPMARCKVRLQVAKIFVRSVNYTPITYLKEDMLSEVSKRRLTLVRRKTLVLDMDETLIASVILGRGRSRTCTDKSALVSTIPYDYNFQLPMSQAQVYVYKRPYVDFFLDRVSQWYNLVIFTAATQPYASPVLDYLDAGRNILNRRMYRHNCINISGIRAKFVSIAHSDLANVLLLDDCQVENSFNVGNAVRIKSFRIGTKDEELLCMLPFLDALRFTHDVRSVLARNIHYDYLTSCLTTHFLLTNSASERI